MEKMDSVQILETIQEESEQEDETVGSSKAIKEQEEEGEDGKLETPVGVETEELLAENERAEDDVPLKVLRPGRRSGSMRQKNPIQGQFREQRKETGSTLVLNASAHSTTCEAAEPMSVFENKRRFSEKLKIKVRKIKLFIFLMFDFLAFLINFLQGFQDYQAETKGIRSTKEEEKKVKPYAGGGH